MNATIDPFEGARPTEVLLPRAPLVRVLAQLRFPTVTALEDPTFVAPIQEALKRSYPILKPSRGQGVFVESLALAAPTVKPFTEWHFSDAEDSWGVTLTPDFVSLQTTAYRSHADFLERLAGLLEVVAQGVKPTHVDRLGVRYINRLVGPSLANLHSYVRPELQGVTVGPIASRIVHSITESLFTVGEARMLARWGVLPPQATLDPTTAPLNEASWVLDLDMFAGQRRVFAPEAIDAQARELTAYVYKFFRWAVTDQFLRECGGQP
jgi:uncharacterized protein (TIGR04255 family)